jgi:hypothetical protein
MCGKMFSPALKFAELLSTAVRTIAARENRTVASVQDELGYALGRETGGSCIEYWRKGHIPADPRDVERLAEELVKRDGLSQRECEQFLLSAEHPRSDKLLDGFFLPQARESSIPEWAIPDISPFVVGPPITMSLLYYLKNITHAEPSELRSGQNADWLPQQGQYQWIFVDFQDARMGNRDRLLRHLLINLDMPAPSPCDLDIFMDIVSHRLQTPTVVMMDEIGAGLASPELDEPFWWSLRSLVSHHTQGNLAFLLTSHISPAQLAQDEGKPSPFFNIFQVLELGPFTDAEARELIDSSPISFSPDDVTWILDQSGRWPCLLQILCKTRLIAIEDGETGDAWQEQGLSQIAPFRYLLAH